MRRKNDFALFIAHLSQLVDRIDHHDDDYLASFFFIENFSHKIFPSTRHRLVERRLVTQIANIPTNCLDSLSHLLNSHHTYPDHNRNVCFNSRAEVKTFTSSINRCCLFARNIGVCREAEKPTEGLHSLCLPCRVNELHSLCSTN